MIIYKHEYSSYNGKITTYEIEVEEKPKSYVVTGKPRGVWESRILKESIGVLDGDWYVKTFSLSADKTDFVKLLISRTDSKIQALENEIAKKKNEKQNLLTFL